MVSWLKMETGDGGNIKINTKEANWWRRAGKSYAPFLTPPIPIPPSPDYHLGVPDTGGSCVM